VGYLLPRQDLAAHFIRVYLKGMHSDAERFASLIAGLEASGISRAEIANQCGLSRANVWRIAVGEARKPAYSTIRRIEKLYEAKIGPSPLRTIRRR
jgi:hypothetical protein